MHGNGNSEGPNQTAPKGAVWSGPGLFPETYMSQFLDFFGLILAY